MWTLSFRIALTDWRERPVVNGCNHFFESIGACITAYPPHDIFGAQLGRTDRLVLRNVVTSGKFDKPVMAGFLRGTSLHLPVLKKTTG